MDTKGKPEPIFIPAQQIIQGDYHSTNTEQQQEITYVDLKYKPEQNYRHLSYVVIILGVMIYFLSIMASSGTNSFGVFLGNVMCWLFFSAGLFLDAAFYKGRSEWQIANGQSNSESKTGMIVDIIVGIFGLWVAIFALVSFLE